MSDQTYRDIKIAYIGGGSRGWAWGLMGDLAREKEISGRVALYDIDFSAAKDNEIIGNRLNDQPDSIGKWKYEAFRSLPDALQGADFVIISILPGTFNEMQSDVHLPEEYGIYQSVGDTVGPGGLVRALRTIPMYVEIAEAIRDHAPDAWVINYTNPMSLCTRTLYEIFPAVKAFGCCHEVFGTQQLMATMLEDICGIEGVNRRDIEVNVLGINHFTWLDQAFYKGMDLMPIYREFANKYAETGFVDKSQEGHWLNSFFGSANRIHFDLFRRYGVIAAAGDRHLAEFMPHSWYLTNPERAREWKIGLTPVHWRKENREKLLERSKRLVDGTEIMTPNPSGEEGVEMLLALLGSGRIITNVNLPNRGQISNLPLGAIVETNAVFGSDSVQPLLAGALPDAVNSLVIRHVYNQETTLQAALKKDKVLAFRTFANDPLVAILAPARAEELFEKMLNNTKAYLPGWKY